MLLTNARAVQSGAEMRTSDAYKIFFVMATFFWLRTGFISSSDMKSSP